MRAKHVVETMFVRGLIAGVRSMSWRRTLGLGAAIGDLAHTLGLRRRVAEANLAIAFPGATADERRRILRAHYRHLGQVACEYARLAELGRSRLGDVVVAARGLEHIEIALRAGRGVIVMSGHYGAPELLATWVGREHPTDFVEKPLSNPGVDAIHVRLIAEVGAGYIPLGAGVRRIYTSLRQNRCVAMAADQDARGDGVFVPFFGRPSSTPIGPAAISIRTGAPIVMGFITRRADGRHEVDILPPLAPAQDTGPEGVRELTARHTACLEDWVRRHPEMYLWLHRRWKTAPPETAAAASAVPVAAAGPRAD